MLYNLMVMCILDLILKEETREQNGLLSTLMKLLLEIRPALFCYVTFFHSLLFHMGIATARMKHIKSLS
jgi:hypothetical protein